MKFVVSLLVMSYQIEQISVFSFLMIKILSDTLPLIIHVVHLVVVLEQFFILQEKVNVLERHCSVSQKHAAAGNVLTTAGLQQRPQRGHLVLYLPDGGQ